MESGESGWPYGERPGTAGAQGREVDLAAGAFSSLLSPSAPKEDLTSEGFRWPDSARV